MYYAERQWGVALTVPLVALSTVVGVALMIVSYEIGASAPGLCATLIQISCVVTVGIGSAAAALAIHASSRVIALSRGDVDAAMEALVSALIVAIGLLMDKFTKISKNFGPNSIGKYVICLRYGERFPQRSFRTADTPEYKAAYEALNNDPTADSKGQISGWGFNARIRRLKMIQKALAPPKVPDILGEVTD